MTTAKDVLKSIKDKEVKYVDLRFTDPRGKWQHVTFDIGMVDEDFFADGTMFDGSSIAGWKAINESDMMLMPDLDTAVIDPFFAQTTLVLICDVLEPTTGQPYDRDPRSIAKKAEAYMVKPPASATPSISARKPSSSSSTTCASTAPYNTGFYSSTPTELPTTSDTEYEAGNLGHRVRRQGRLLPGPAGRLGAGHARRDARASWATWASRPKSTTTKSPPPSTSSASSSTR